MRKKIVLVDDEASLRRTLTLGLSQAGYDTEPCENGLTGLKTLENYSKSNIKPDAVILDIQLPDIDGLKLVKIIKFKYPGTPIILITGYAFKYNMEEIRHLDVSSFLEKPFTPEELVVQIEKILAEEPVPEKVEEVVPGASAYLLLKVSESAGFFDIYKHLHLMESVVYCDATKGDYDIIMFIQDENKEKINEFVENYVKKTHGVQSVDVLPVEAPVLDEITAGIIKDAQSILEYYSTVTSQDKEKMLGTYLLLEVEKEKLGEIYPTLRLDESVIFCDYTVGKYNLALMVKMDDFGAIDKFISERLNTLEGIIKIKKYPIIKLFEM